jgi:hypothetical protein
VKYSTTQVFARVYSMGFNREDFLCGKLQAYKEEVGWKMLEEIYNKCHQRFSSFEIKHV